MRSFIAMGLALVAGCGDNLSAGDDPLNPSEDFSVDTGMPEMTERFSPQICGAETLESVRYDAKDSIVRAIPTKTGAAVFMVPSGGGMLRGFQVDGRGTLMGNPEGQKIRSNATFTDVSAAYLDERMVVAAVVGAQTSVMAIRDDLQDYRELARVDGALMGTAAMMRIHNTRVSATGGPSGMLMSTFDANWAAMGTEVVARSVPVSMTSTAYSNDAMISWSTPNECHVQRVGAGIESMRPFPCLNARVAASYAAHAGWLVYERDGSIMLARITVDAPNQLGTEQQLVRFGTAPRIAFDGTRYWVSYVDVRGDLVVGLLDSSGALVGVAVEGTQPRGSAYDLVIAGGNAWLYAIDGNGVGATKLCVSNR